MGSGKTSVGRLLAKKLNMSFVDMDKEIEAAQGRAIQAIFDTEGEDYFRDLETAYLKETEGLENTILSTGGGIIKRDENIALVKELGQVIFLQADARHIMNNVGEDKSRPLLRVEDVEGTIKQLLEEREPKYLSAADVIIQTTKKSIDHIVEEIISII